MSVVIPVRAAEEAGVEAAFACEWITLQAETELDMVGLTAEFASRLADAGIPCNVVAGTRHDHLFVPAGRGAEAVALLT